MTILSIRKFNGEIPRLPADRLPEDGAQLAVNCDFTHGELRPLRALGRLYPVAPEAKPCRAVFTHDGYSFFAWNAPTRAYLAPTIDDQFYRVFYNTEGYGLRVAQTTDMRLADDLPGPPTASWTVGVARPTSLEVVVDGGGGEAPGGTYGPLVGVDVASTANGASVLVTSIAAVDVTEIIPLHRYSLAVPEAAIKPPKTGTQLTPTAGTNPTIAGDKPITFETSWFVPLFYTAKTSAAAGMWHIDAQGNLYFGATPPDTYRDPTYGNVHVRIDDADIPYVLALDNNQYALDKNDGQVWPLLLVDGKYYRAFSYTDKTDTPKYINYNGVRYEPASKLYDAFINGTAGAASTSAVSLVFTAKFQRNDGSDEAANGIPLTQTWVGVEDADPATVRRYIISSPDYASTAGTSGSAAITPGKANTVVYVAVAQNRVFEQSAPSSPLIVEVPETGLSVPLKAQHTPDPMQIPLSGDPGGMLFYRTYPGFSSTQYFLINDAPVKPDVNGDYLFTDTSTQPLTTTTLAANQAEWDAPPTDLKCLTYAGNGSFAGASGKYLCFSEPYKPHAWAYRMLFPQEVVGVIEVEGGVLVTTTAKPYLVFGAHPSQMSQQVLNADQAGWSWSAMARVEGTAVYANNDGLVRVSGGQASIKESQQLFTRQDWRDRYGDEPLKLRLAQHDGRLLGLVDPN